MNSIFYFRHDCVQTWLPLLRSCPRKEINGSPLLCKACSREWVKENTAKPPLDVDTILLAVSEGTVIIEPYILKPMTWLLK